jgi:hypothetical protein
MARKLSKKRTTHLIDTTSKIYSNVCEELGFSIEKLQIMISQKLITLEAAQEEKEKIDIIYCERICKLDTKLLEDFLNAHVTGQIRRASRTMDMVQKELLERVMNEDNKSNSD